MRRLTLGHFVDVDRVLQILHVLFITGDVEDGRPRFRQFDGELSPLGAQLDGRIQTTTVATVIVLVVAIQRHIQGSFVVIKYGNCHVDVRSVAVVNPAVMEVTVQILGLRIELEMLVAKLP